MNLLLYMIKFLSGIHKGEAYDFYLFRNYPISYMGVG